MTASTEPEGVSLSRREAEVLELVGAHLTNAQIGARLFISVRTVESHVSSLLRKSGAADRRELAALAAERPVAGRAVEGPRPVERAPVAFTRFIGRSGDVDAVLGALTEARLVTLTGPGGIGKTRLALEVGARHPAVAAWFVDLVPASPGMVAAAVATSVGVNEKLGASLVEAVSEALGNGASLLILDNAEHVLDDAAEVVERLVRLSTELSVLVTSREPLGLLGEKVLPIRPLEIEGADAAALELFRDRASAGGAVLGPSDDAVIGAICTHLDGIPLAIELAAARCASLGVDGLQDALDDRLRLLVGARGGDPRHRSLRGVLDWSHDLLDDEERAVLRRAALFHNEFTAPEAEAVAGAGMARGVARDALGRLAAKSLVTSRPGAQGFRYRMLETVRAYAHEQLEAAGEADAAAESHVAWCVAVAGSLLAGLDADGEVPVDADRLVDDLRAGLAWAVRQSGREQAWRLARSLGHLQYARGFFVESRQHLEQAADLAPDPVDASVDLSDAAHAAYVLLLGDIGYGLFRAAAERAIEGGRPDLAAIALATAVERAGRFPAEFPTAPDIDDLRALAQEARLLDDGSSPLVEANVALAEAWVSTDLATVTLREPSERALDLARAIGDPRLESAATDALAAALVGEGTRVASTDLSLGRLELLTRLDPLRIADGTEQLDILHMAIDAPLTLGDLPTALAVHERARRHPLVSVITHMVQRELVIGLCLTGRFEEAIEQAEIMQVAWDRLGRPVAGWMAPAAYLTAMAHGLRGDRERFEAWLGYGTQANPTYPNDGSSFATMRVLLHAGDTTGALAELAHRQEVGSVEAVEVPDDLPSGNYSSYFWALVADVYAAAGHPQAKQRIEQVRRLTDEHRWAEPCLQRAEGRLERDPELLRTAAEGFDAIDARFEAAATRALLPGTEGGAGTEALNELGCRPPG